MATFVGRLEEFHPEREKVSDYLMDTMLQDIPHTICYLDDILVTGKDDCEHLQNLEEVLTRLSNSGLTLKQPKCAFMQRSVQYLGHCIDAHGIILLPTKLLPLSRHQLQRI